MPGRRSSIRRSVALLSARLRRSQRDGRVPRTARCRREGAPRAGVRTEPAGPGQLYGDATAIAGDFLAHPSEFLSQTGASRFNSKKSYYPLALENSAHFNPTSTRSWAEYHQQAITYALQAAAGEGLTTVEQFQLALFESAFADHYLQDSFAAGHMGFNRRGLERGRRQVVSRCLERPRARGDRSGGPSLGDIRRQPPRRPGQRGRPPACDGSGDPLRARVLTAFVLGARVPEDEIAVWQILPFTIEAPELLGGRGGGVRQGNAGNGDGQPRAGAVAAHHPPRLQGHGGDRVLLVGGRLQPLPAIPTWRWSGASSSAFRSSPRRPISARGTFQAPERKRAAVIDTGVLDPARAQCRGSRQPPAQRHRLLADRPRLRRHHPR